MGAALQILYTGTIQKIILISGFGGSGKSTCAQLLCEKLESAAIVEADHLFRIKPLDIKTEEGREQIGRIKLRNSLSVIETFIKEGFSYIIVDGLVWSQGELDAVVDLAQKKKIEVWCFWLKTSANVRHKRVIDRAQDEADTQEFLDAVEQNIPDPTPLKLSDGHYEEIETDMLSADQIVSKLMERLG